MSKAEVSGVIRVAMRLQWASAYELVPSVNQGVQMNRDENAGHGSNTYRHNGKQGDKFKGQRIHHLLKGGLFDTFLSLYI